MSDSKEDRAIIVHPNDNVVISLSAFSEGEELDIVAPPIFIKNTTPRGHKIASKNISAGEMIYKYGGVIGHATQDIGAGEHVHTHNMTTNLKGKIDYTYAPEKADKPYVYDSSITSFDGYKRPDGKVGTRNEVWILSTVGCVSHTVQRLANKADALYGDRCDGVFAFTHPFGCSQVGGDLNQTRDLVAALANHPNAGGVLIVGLGCENNQGKHVLELISPEKRDRIRFFNAQEEEDEFAAGMKQLDELTALAEKDVREPCPLSDLALGMKCGGSDGLSGITANPLLGRLSDKVCDEKGTVLQTEVPEMFGAEQALMNRATDAETYERIVSLINDFKQYYLDNNIEVYENPSPGNKDGGITTLEEKSMGAIQKGGNSIITDVLDYAEPARKKGLSLIRAPGNDAISSTALTASGATLILFTTGRGTPLGFPAPTIKVASNSGLAKRKANWIDFNSGTLVEGESSQAVDEAFLTLIVDIASGRKKSQSEQNEQREIAVWKTGVTL